jgi:hypothetical protein
VRFSASGVSDASACSPNCAADLTPQATRYPTTRCVVGYGFREAVRGQVPTDKKTNTTHKGAVFVFGAANGTSSGVS